MLQTRGPLELDQVFNFRDLGGLSTVDGRMVRTGRIFRADGLHRLTEQDREVLAPLALRTVIDLRTNSEVERWGHANPAVIDAEVHHLSVLQNTWDHDAVEHAVDAATFLAAAYRTMLDEGPTAIATALRLIADPDRHGLVFHCAAGKDRTGVVAALVLALSGVGDDDIAADYAATAPSMLRMQEWYVANTPEGREIMSQQPPAFMACPPEAMLGFLRTVRSEWGTVHDMATDRLGLAPDEIDQLRRSVTG